MYDYAKMDNIMASSQLAIGWSSNLAMLSLTYYWTELSQDNVDEDKLKDLYDNFVILAVLAQVAIDSCKRLYSINVSNEINRIQNMSCMQYVRYEIDSNGKKKKHKYDFPIFMRYIREPAHSKNKSPIPYDVIKKEKDRLEKRINPDFICPMNWLIEALNEAKIRKSTYSNIIPTKDYFVKNVDEKADISHLSKINRYVIEYDAYIKSIVIINNEDANEEIFQKSEDFYNMVRGLKLGKATVNRIVETALGLDNDYENYDNSSNRIQASNKKYRRKLLNCMYKTNKEYFLNCFLKDIAPKEISVKIIKRNT